MSRVPGALLPPLAARLGPRRVCPAEPAGPPAAGPDPLSSLAWSWQTAQPSAAPGLRLPPPPDAGAYDSEDEDEDTLGPVAEAEQSVLALHRCLALLEDPNAQALGARVRPPSGDAAPAAFYCPARAHVARLDALLRQRRLLRLARTLTRRLQAAAAFVRRLGHLLEQQARRERPGEPGDGQPLRSLCEELWTLAGHRRQLRDDPRLRALGPEVLAGMRQALGLLGRQATLLLERYAEGLLRSLARAGPPACPALLTDLCQGLELYNRALSDQAAEPALGSSQLDPTAPLGPQVAPGGQAQVFSSSRVLGVLAAERGCLAAQRLHRLLLQRVQAGGGGPSSWEEATAPRPPDAQIPEDAVAEELQALCRVDARLLDLVLAASPTALWHHGPAWPRQEAPETTWSSLSQLSGCRPDAEALHAQYRLLVWEAAAAALGRLLELPELLGSLAPRGGRAMLALAQELSQVLNRAQVPQECVEELQRLCLHLLCQGVFFSWDRGFCQALGSSLTDKCSPGPGQAGATARSKTAGLLQHLYPPLAFALRHLQPPRSGCATSGLQLELLSLCVATGQLARAWVTAKAQQHLASWAVGPFLLVTHGDLQLLRAETERLSTLAGCSSLGGGCQGLISHLEWQLRQQLRATATGIQALAEEAPWMLGAACHRLSAELLTQTMPLGRHWRPALRAEPPSTPSEYAVAATQAVLAPALQGIQLLPHDTQVPTLTLVLTAFVEAWMEHILAHRIKFRWMAPSPASCSSPGPGPALARPGRPCASAAPAVAGARRPPAPAASTAWRAWKWGPPLPWRCQAPTCSTMRRAVPHPSPTSPAPSSSGSPCGCTEPGAGGCPACPAWAAAPSSDPQPSALAPKYSGQHSAACGAWSCSGGHCGSGARGLWIRSRGALEGADPASRTGCAGGIALSQVAASPAARCRPRPLGVTGHLPPVSQVKSAGSSQGCGAAGSGRDPAWRGLVLCGPAVPSSPGLHAHAPASAPSLESPGQEPALSLVLCSQGAQGCVAPTPLQEGPRWGPHPAPASCRECPPLPPCSSEGWGQLGGARPAPGRLHRQGCSSGPPCCSHRDGPCPAVREGREHPWPWSRSLGRA
ncbi:coiled-coil domain-containing protein 142 isoform X2 [Alligator mississippiensis]|uniref:coiled-coil domain-containing protein 142 isoform X2 n=1 Tax=Alligator mississippiensis TaxID=8496 RepID=UPI0028778A96|nr:coiled-coil domain-containing protein 142 isoform X2 [Alligator mississippiensis]